LWRFWAIFKQNFPFFFLKEGICVQQNIPFLKKHLSKMAKNSPPKKTLVLNIKSPPRQLEFYLRTIVLSRPATCSDVHAF
jgi:hypothetical protein